jgi:Xaa-Pro dipeptidase
MDIGAEIATKKARVRRLLEEKGLSAVYLKTQANFSWLTGGRLNTVGIAMELGVVGLLLTRDREYAVCNNIEAPRMEREEKLEEQGYELHSFPWYEDRELEIVKKLAGEGEIGSDFQFVGLQNIASSVAPLRFSLLPAEVQRYKELGRLASRAIEETAFTVRPGDKECEITGRLAERLWSDRVDYITVFCAADERIADFRHPIPTEKRIDKRAMICANARKWGLIVSLTRFVQFQPVSQELRRIYDANVHIDCTLMANTIPGRPAVEAFNRGIEDYKVQGFPEEFKLHHQGGSIGYVGRDYKVNFETDHIVEENQAFSWNPSITGSKSEDVMIATADGPVLLTKPELFPVLEMEVDGYHFGRPDILVVS